MICRGQSTSRAVVKCVRRYCSYNHQQLYMQLTPQGLVMLLYGLSKFNAWHPDWFKQQLLAAVTSKLQQCLSGSSSCSNSSTGSRAGFKSHELPIVLLLLVHLRINLPTALLEQVDGLLLQQQDGQHQQQHQQGQQQQRQQQQGQQRLQIDSLSVGELSTCLYALGVAKHHPSVGFMEAAAARVQQQVLEMCQRDVAFVLYGLAAMANTGEQQRMQQQEELLQRLLVTAERVRLLMFTAKAAGTLPGCTVSVLHGNQLQSKHSSQYAMCYHLATCPLRPPSCTRLLPAMHDSMEATTSCVSV